MDFSTLILLAVLVVLVMLVVRIGSINQRLDEMEDVMADKPSRSYVNRLVSGKTDPISDSESSDTEEERPVSKSSGPRSRSRSTSRRVRFDESAHENRA